MEISVNSAQTRLALNNVAMEYLSLVFVTSIWFSPVFSQLPLLGTSKLYGFVESKSHGKMLCESDGLMLPADVGDQQSAAILKTLQDSNLPNAWLDLDLTAADKWLFTNGRELGSKDAIYEPKGSCALLKKYHLTGVRCDTEVDGFICEKKGCRNCDGFCLKSETNASICLKFYRESCNWYGAITKCSMRGKTLGVQSVDILRAVMGRYKEAWIGLRQGLWKFHLPNNRSFAPKTHKWSFSTGEGRCATIYKVNKSLAWKPVTCDEKYPALCFEYSYFASTGTFISEDEYVTSGATGSTTDSVKLSTLALIGFTFLSTVVLVIVVLAILCVFSRKSFERHFRVMYIVREDHGTTPSSSAASSYTFSSERSNEEISFYAMARMPSHLGLQPKKS